MAPSNAFLERSFMAPHPALPRCSLPRGTPAVAFNAPGLNESIVNDRNGLLASDDCQFVKHLIDILKKTSLRQRLEAGAVKRADEFNWDDVARQSLEVLEEAVASRP